MQGRAFVVLLIIIETIAGLISYKIRLITIDIKTLYIIIKSKDYILNISLVIAYLLLTYNLYRYYYFDRFIFVIAFI